MIKIYLENEGEKVREIAKPWMKQRSRDRFIIGFEKCYNEPGDVCPNIYLYNGFMYDVMYSGCISHHIDINSVIGSL